MTKLQAALKDKSAKAWNETKQYYRIGSHFKGCLNCGIKEEDEDTGSVRYLSGFQVFRSYKPWWIGWTYKCMECNATDLKCWEGASDIGKEPIVGCRDAVKARKDDIRKAAQDREPRQPRAPRRTRNDEIEELRREIARLTLVLQKGVKS